MYRATLIEQHFKTVIPRSRKFAELFYNRLFSNYPQVKPLFSHTDMRKQQEVLFEAIDLIVMHFRDPHLLYDIVRDLAHRYRHYGVTRNQYAWVGRVLIETLAEISGEKWNRELEEAWSEAYGVMQVMIYQALDECEAAA